ncbi:MAG TPA: glutamate cyclase domain-containing protein [Nitrolancea sp.]|jgi:hypothetical protein|nr:glutamate cyclase domain-containing protein [Nitrolancea sp.]
MTSGNDGLQPLPQANLATWDNMDRAVTIGFRAVGHSRGSLPLLYDLARGDEPITYLIAKELLQQRGAHVGILTGAAVPEYLPNGENDGPLGAIVLGNALKALGYRVTILTESELSRIFDELFTVYGSTLDMIELAKDDATDHAGTAPDLDALISIEKLGSNAKHVMHGATGVSRNGTRAHVDGLVNRLNDAGKLTVGIGDGGNEIGFGKIYTEARELLDYGKQCRCECNDGIVTVTGTKYLFPVGVSNWGAYAVTSALAAATGEFGILHTPEREMEIIAAATRVDCRDGGAGTARDYVDSVPASTSAAIVEILKSLAEKVDEHSDRPF